MNAPTPIEAIVTPGSSGKIEDRIIVSGRVLAVIDGAGSPEPSSVDGTTSGSFAAQWVADRLVLLPPGRDLRDYVLTANEEFAHALRERRIDPSAKPEVPAASLVVMVLSGGGADLVQIGDCLAGADRGGQEVGLFAMQQAPWDQLMQRELDELRAAGAAELEVALRKRELDRDSREVMNTAGGFGTFAGDPGVVAIVASAHLESVTRIVLASDGLTDWLRCDPETALRRALKADPLLALLDPTVVPRGHDDLSVMRVSGS